VFLLGIVGGAVIIIAAVADFVRLEIDGATRRWREFDGEI
jgi:hypothetical protein